MITKNRTLTNAQRTKFAEKFIDFGHLTFAGLVIGQVVGSTVAIKPHLILIGAIALIVSYTFAYGVMLTGGERHE